MNRRSFFKAASGLLLAVAAPLAVEPERRVWALDRTMAASKGGVVVAFGMPTFRDPSGHMMYGFRASGSDVTYIPDRGGRSPSEFAHHVYRLKRDLADALNNGDPGVKHLFGLGPPAGISPWEGATLPTWSALCNAREIGT